MEAGTLESQQAATSADAVVSRTTSPAATARAIPRSTPSGASRSTSPRQAPASWARPARASRRSCTSWPASTARPRARCRSTHRDHEPERQRPHEAPPAAHRIHLPVLQPADARPRGASSCRPELSGRKPEKSFVDELIDKSRPRRPASEHRPAELSGGQQRRVCSAHVLATTCSPTSRPAISTRQRAWRSSSSCRSRCSPTADNGHGDARLARGAIADRLFLADGQIVRELGRCDQRHLRGARRGSPPCDSRRAQRLAGRKLRASLTAVAIILGVAMMSGAYV